MFVGHFPQKSTIIGGSFAENDLQLKEVFATLYAHTVVLYVYIYEYTKRETENARERERGGKTREREREKELAILLQSGEEP